MFELYNVANEDYFKRLDELAVAGKIDKAGYVTRLNGSEANAAEKTRSFFVNVFLPWAREHNVPSNPDVWFIGSRHNRKESLATSDQRNREWQFYANHYDILVLMSLVEKREFDKVLSSARTMLRNVKEDQERSAIYLACGVAYQEKGDDKKSISFLDEAVRLSGKDSRPRFVRGRFYRDRRNLRRR